MKFTNRYSDKLFSTIFLSPLLLCLVILLLSSCKYEEVTVGQLSGMKINKITNEGVEMEMGIQLKNPNSYGFTIFPSSFDVSLGGTNLGKAHLSKKEKVGPNSDEVHTFLIKTSFDQLTQGGLPGLINLFAKKNPEVEIKGTLKAGKFLFRKRIPIDRKQNTKMENNAGGGLFNMH
jgi:LEA14-like dessication related protein